MKLFLDDVRTPPKGFHLVKTATECIEFLKQNRVEYLSLDHDLGNDEDGTGNTVLLWIEEQVHTNPNFEVPVIAIHSANPVGIAKMRAGIEAIRKYNNESVH